MTERETVLLREFKGKLDRLIDLQLRLKRENQLLREGQAQLNEQLRLLTQQKDELGKKYEYLKMAQAVNNTTDDSHEAKLKLNKLVREIDQCIALLNK